jgi:thioesterase domain-containing protein/acyl carrier protein
LTRDRFVADPFSDVPGARLYRSGDLARVLANHDIEYIGRADQQVKIRGFRVELEEIQSVLERLADVRRSAVIVRDASGERQLVAYVEPSPGRRPVIHDLRAHLKNELPDYMVPSVFVVVDQLPLTAHGKLDRAALPNPSDDDVSAGRARAFVAPSTETEVALADVWAQVLGIQRVGADDNFFDLGGHSLLAITLFSRIRDRFGRSLPIGTLFERPTIRGLSALLPSPVRRVPSSTLHLLSPGGNKPPIVLMHGVDGSLWDSMRVAKYLGDQRPVYGLQTIPADSDAQVTVEGIAAQCVEALLEKVPAGPYHLAGFCTAAKTAIEVANQLQARRQQVGLIAVLDYGTVDEPLPRSMAGAVVDFIRNLPLWIAYDLIPVGPARLAGRVRSRLRLAGLAIEKRLRWRPSDAKPDIRDELGIWRYPADQVGFLTAIWNAFDNYTLRPFAGRISLFRPRAEPLLPRRWPKDLGWGKIATGGVDVIDVPGSHETMLEETFVPAVAARLAKALEQAEATGGPDGVSVSSNVATPLPRPGSLTDLAPRPARDTAGAGRVF